MQTNSNPFQLPLNNPWLANIVERTLGLKKLIEVYATRPRAPEKKAFGIPFLDHTLSALGVTINVEQDHLLEDVPQNGPMIFVANHPLGGLEGVALTRLLLNKRSDLLVLTNKMLTSITELSDIFIGVDVLAKNAAAENAKGIRQICKHLSNGGAVLIFPAGMVSAIDKQTRTIRDKPWDTLVGRLILKYQATSMPFFVRGRNSKLFYLLGLIHPRLRTLMLARELSNKNGSHLSIRAGKVITLEEIKTLNHQQQVTDYLRVATDLLRNPTATDNLNDNLDDPSSIYLDSIEKPNLSTELIQDIHRLEEFLLLEKQDFQVYCAPFDKLGSVMKEIAFAREVTFRAAGEGTGKPFDSDQFDPHYLHLFLWDKKQEQLVGGYRVGRCDQIIQEFGIKALYSRCHYQFDERYLAQLGNCLEMGRSFITPDYQRHPRALDMLWQGIGTYVAQNPEYHTLFGCVSISQEHSELARAFLSDSMMECFGAEEKFLKNIRPSSSLKIKDKLWDPKNLASLANITAINKLLGRCDPGKSIPVLLRQYLALNGRLVCFSVNEGFNNSLDGLILVDLRKTPPKYLKRYLGVTGSKHFLTKWGNNEATV